jgi:uncharacterized repeat protein (TIGR01451 family)
MNLQRIGPLWAAFCVIGFASLAATQTSGEHTRDPRLAVRLIAEVVTKSSSDGRERPKLVDADEVVPGDEVIYTLEIRNTSAIALPPPTVDYPVPDHMRYVENSAIGAGADVRFSVDGGRTFDRPDKLKLEGAHGERPATAADYTHIRWQLKHILKGNSVAMAHFRAIVK